MADTPNPKSDENLTKDTDLLPESNNEEPKSAPALPEGASRGRDLSDIDTYEFKGKEESVDDSKLGDAGNSLDSQQARDPVGDIEIDETKDAAKEPDVAQEALDNISIDAPETPTAGDIFKTPEEAAASDTILPDAQPITPATMPVKPNKSFKHWTKTHKKTTVFLTLVIILAVVAAVPWTRYKVAGTFLRQTQTIQILDSQTNQPVTGAKVTVGDRTKITDSKGSVTLDPKVGSREVVVQKANYAGTSTEQLIPIFKSESAIRVHLKATGRQVGIKVVNSITGKPVENASFKIDGSEFKINTKGLATIVAPADSKELDATILAEGYVTAKATLLVSVRTTQIQTYKLTPSGKVYFLSNLSGKLDVVKANLDGTERQTVLAGTGNEDVKGTALLASRDWKYLALLSRRDGGKNDKLFLINTSNDKVSVIDEGDASFTLVGWQGHDFVYTMYRTTKQQWDSGRQVIKSFNAESGKLASLDENQTTGAQSSYGYQVFGNPYITSKGIVYGTYWEVGYGSTDRSVLAGKLGSIRSIDADGKNKKDVKTFDATTTGTLDARLYTPDEVYFAVYDYDKKGRSFYTYENAAVKEATTVTNDTFHSATYPTYVLSPSGKQTFWGENRDGKNSLFLGDAEGKNQQQIASLSEYSAYGWFTDDYLLVAKNSSELYIMPKTGGTPLKVTDYYKPNLNFAGYGYGYGGL